ncbi:hypothetical protein VPH35_109488 [Triticum aestivum]
MAAVTFEEEVSRLAARMAANSPARVRVSVVALAHSSAARAAADGLVLFYDLISSVGQICQFCATFFRVIAFRASVLLSEIKFYSGMVSLLLMAPAIVLFFLRAAGSEVNDDVVKDRFRRWTLHRTSAAIWKVFFPTTAVDLIGLRDAALLCKLLVIALFCIRTAVALRRMNP